MFHLETHTNCGHEGTNNGIKNCSSPIMPQSHLDPAIKTLNFNADIKALNTSLWFVKKPIPESYGLTLPPLDMLRIPVEACLRWSGNMPLIGSPNVFQSLDGS
jgi:hypothetical protein